MQILMYVHVLYVSIDHELVKGLKGENVLLWFKEKFVEFLPALVF